MTLARPIGSTKLNHAGYVLVKTTERVKPWRFQHRVVWEAAHGPIPEGARLHHRNHDKTDNRLENLELCASNGAHIRDHHAEQARAQCPRMNEIWRGAKHSPETRAQMSAAKKGVRKTASHIANHAAAMRGKKLSPEHCAKLGEARRGRPLSAAHRAAIAAGNRGKPKSPEHRAKIAAAVAKATRKENGQYHGSLNSDVPAP